VLLLTADELVRADVARLAAAAGCPLRVCDHPQDARRWWASGRAVLVGGDLLEPLVLLGLPRRAGVHVVAGGGLDTPRLRAAVAVGAETVTDLPEGAGQVADLLGEVVDSHRPPGRVVGIVAGSGGVGASVLTVALATTAAATGAEAVAVDLDPRGAGLGMLAGHDDGSALDWDSLAVGRGRLNSTALRESLARARGPSVLGWGVRSSRSAPPDDVVAETLASARRGHDLVVVDSRAPRTWTSYDAVVLVAAGSLHGVAAAARVVAELPAGVPAGLAVRSARRDAWAVEGPRALGLPLWAVVTEQRALDEHLSAGLGPARRRRAPLARAAAELLGALEVAP
jgi:secretion/DNA translocation related CpaE-like protein